MSKVADHCGDRPGRQKPCTVSIFALNSNNRLDKQMNLEEGLLSEQQRESTTQLCRARTDRQQAVTAAVQRQKISANWSRIPTVLVPIFQPVELLHLPLRQLPRQERFLAVLLHKAFMDCLWDDCTSLLQAPPQQHLYIVRLFP